jgi:hypothetical protein
MKTNPSDYGLLTQTQVDEASEKGERTGIDKVTSNPNEYELFTQTQVDDAKEMASHEGIDQVTSNPNDYELIPKTVILTGSGTYLVGDMLDIKLEVSIEASHLQQVDLWVIIKLPEALGNGFIYMTNDPFHLFDPSPTPFKRSLQHLEKTYPILSFEVPPNFGGEYILYAFFTQEGSGLDSLFSTLRSSNVAETTVIFSNK